MGSSCREWDLPRCGDVSYYSEMVEQLCGEASPRYCRDQLTLRIRPTTADSDVNEVGQYTPCFPPDEYNLQVQHHIEMMLRYWIN